MAPSLGGISPCWHRPGIRSEIPRTRECDRTPLWQVRAPARRREVQLGLRLAVRIGLSPRLVRFQPRRDRTAMGARLGRSPVGQTAVANAAVAGVVLIAAGAKSRDLSGNALDVRRYPAHGRKSSTPNSALKSRFAFFDDVFFFERSRNSRLLFCNVAFMLGQAPVRRRRSAQGVISKRRRASRLVSVRLAPRSARRETIR